MSGSPATAADFLATAMVGTDRRQTTVDGSGDPAVGVLDQAAAWATFRRAGVRPVTGVAQPDPAAPESQPVVSDRAALRLAGLLDGEVTQLDAASRLAVLEEWLTIAAERGRRVPPALLPDLLHHGRQHTALRMAIATVGGARARWLAGQNPDWRYLTAVESTSDDPDGWTEGTPGQRVGYLRRLRQRDPDAGRALLSGEWPTLAPGERVDLLSTVEESLGPGDEVLLERALDDRRREVREVAARLLARLPASAYAGRMLDRARACLSFRDGAIAAVTPPVACDPGMRRDGVVPRPPAGTGERAWWLEEILARVPLPALPRPLPVLPSVAEWAGTIHRGLARAAATYQDADWAVELLDRLDRTPADRELAAALYPALPGDERVRRAIEALQSGDAPAWGALLASCPAPWPDTLAVATLRGLEALARPDYGGEVYRLCRLAAVRMPVTMAGPAEQLSERIQLGGAAGAALNALGFILRYRYEINQELV